MTDLPKPYDILYPAPPSLEQLSTISIAQEVWRQGKRLKRRLYEHSERESNIILKDFLRSKLPSTIFSSICAYERILKESIRDWQEFHYEEEINKLVYEIPGDFDDIVCNYDGKIHYGKTAKQLIRCDGVDVGVKFKIACLYCLEDEVSRFWPFVRVGDDILSGHRNLYVLIDYWAKRMRNPSFQVSFTYPLEDAMGSSLSSLEYFWNHLSSNDKLELFDRCDKSISCRYLLTKLDEEMLNTVANTKAVELISKLLGMNYFYKAIDENEPLALATWIYIKDKMSASSFVELVREIAPKHASTFREMWRSASDHLKQAVIHDLRLNSSAYVVEASFNPGFRKVDFLLTILPDASIPERKIFWQESWTNFCFNVRPADLQRVTNLCFSDENEILRIKENSMCKYENIGDYCGKLLNVADFSTLNELLRYCCPDESKSREVCSKVLRHKFEIKARHVEYADDSNEFINNAFESIDLANDFKNQLLVSPETMSVFKKLLNDYCFSFVSEFVDTLKTSEEITLRVKNEVIELTVGVMQANGDVFSVSHSLKPFLEWCFVNNNDGVVRFRQMFRVSEVVQAVTDSIRYENSKMKWCPDFSRQIVTCLEMILKWCFETDEAFEEFRSDPSNELLFKLIAENSELYNKRRKNE